MALTETEGRELITQFCKQYPAALQISYKVRETQEEAFHENATKERAGTLLGAYFPSQNIAAFATSNFRDANEFEDTLRHEVIGHFGINTRTAEEKRSILEAISDARSAPGLDILWQQIDRLYEDAPEIKKAEEVFAFACESIEVGQRVSLDDSERSLRETCIERSRPMQASDLTNIASMIADSLRERTTVRQVIPASDHHQFKREDGMDTPKKTYAEQVAEKLIEQLKQGTAPWQKPWEAGVSGTMPMNPTTGNRYKGINAINLMMQGHDDPRWMTYNQAKQEGAQVRKGEKSTMIQYWKFTEERTKKDESGKPVLDSKGEKVKENVLLERPKCFNAFVFNASQIDGLPPIQKKEQSWDAIERAEHILAASGAKIKHVPGDRAFYSPSTDAITMPERGQFNAADKYYATALHELGHWTGHGSRLDRDLTNPFGSEGYAKEELRAEIASMIIGDELGIGHDPAQHASYVKSWIKVLQDDPLEVFRAASDAEKIQKFVMAFEQKQVQTEHQSQEHAAVLAHLASQPNSAALDAWRALEAKAGEQGVAASLSWTNLGDGEPDIAVSYQKGNKPLSLQTQINSRNGEGRTMLDGAEMPMGIRPDTKRAHVANLNAGIFHIQSQTSPEQIKQEQAEVLAHITQKHQDAEPGYSALESWMTLEDAAKHMIPSVTPVMRWNPGVDEYDPDIRIDYFESDGKRLSAYTELNSGDGKAVSHVKEGVRVPGTGLTTEPEWQVAALVSAVIQARSESETQQEQLAALAPKQAPRWKIESRNSFEPNPQTVVVGETDSATEAIELFQAHREATVTDTHTGKVSAYTDWVRDGAATEKTVGAALEAYAAIEQKGLSLPQPATGLAGPDRVLSERIMLAENHPRPNSFGHRLLATSVNEAVDDAFGPARPNFAKNAKLEGWNGEVRVTPIVTEPDLEFGGGHRTRTAQPGEAPEEYDIEVQNREGKWQWFATELSSESAEAIAGRLERISEHAGLTDANAKEKKIVDEKLLVAEQWILERVATPGEALGTLPAAIARMNDKQLDTTFDVLDSMHPLGNDNEFWRRHEDAAEAMYADPDGVEDRIFAAKEAIRDRMDALAAVNAPHLESIAFKPPINDADKEFAGLLRDYRASAEGASATSAMEPYMMVHEGVEHSIKLPNDWTGGIQTRGVEYADGGIAEAAEGDAQFYGVYAQDSEGLHWWVADVATEQQANDLAERLKLVDAYGKPDENEQAAALARIHEEQVRQDPNSTSEDIAAAKDSRKNAEMTAMLNDADLQRRIADFEKQADKATEKGNIAQEKTWLAVPFAQIEQAKEAAGKLKGTEPAITFDKQAKCWYAKPGANLDKVKQWLPENQPRQTPAMAPKEEFSLAMKDLGLTVPDGHPIADGKIHRVPVQGGSKGNTSGAYKLYSVEAGEKGVPAGYIENFKTGIKTTWKAKGYSLSDGDKSVLNAEAAQRNAQRERERVAAQERSVKAIQELLAVATPAQAGHTYLNNKQARPGDLKTVPADTAGLPADSIIMIGKDAKESRAMRKDNPDRMIFTAGDLLLTAQNAKGEIQSVQSIRPNGTKMMAKGAEKTGGFHVVGGKGLDALKAAPAIVVGEGYATADTASSALGFATVAAFDSGNLPKVARELKEVFPDKPFVIIGDNDLHQEMIDGKNPGKTKAIEAAKLAEGKAVFPVFAPGEQSYPKDVPPIEAEAYRKNELSQEQKDALNKMKSFTDFNDLATKSQLGRAAMERQLKAAVDLAMDKSEKLDVQQAQEVEKLEQVKHQKIGEPHRKPRRAIS